MKEDKDLNKDIADSDIEDKEEVSIFREIFSWIQVIVIAVVVAFLLNTFVIANSRVPSGSMENTIMTGSRVIGLRLSYVISQPQRGDVVIFVFGIECKNCHVITEQDLYDSCPNCGESYKTSGKTAYYVKRLIGLPGDTIDIKDGHVYLNGSDTPLDEPYIKEIMDIEAPQHFEVPDGHYFFLGDNRNNSMDARYWNNHYIPKHRLVAKVYLEYYPQFKFIK